MSKPIAPLWSHKKALWVYDGTIYGLYENALFKYNQDLLNHIDRLENGGNMQSKTESFKSWCSRNTVPESTKPLCRGAHSAAWEDKPEPVNEPELACICELLMVNDPWPIGPNRDVFESMADRIAFSLGYDNWIDAYHRSQK